MNILPIQSNDTNYIEVVNIVPPSAETGRSIGIDLSASAKNTLDNIQTSLDLKSNLNNPIFPGTHLQLPRSMRRHLYKSMELAPPRYMHQNHGFSA